MNSLDGLTIGVGVTGGIAAYKAAELISRLVKLGACVVPIMTENARRFIAPLTLEALANQPAVYDMFERPRTWDVEHIALAKRMNALVIAPCTANVIGKLASGIADDFLTTVAMATRAPILLAPAMNDGMWTSDAVRDNMAVLRKRGVFTVGPAYGRLAEGGEGEGRMSQPVEIVEAIFAMLTPKDLAGVSVLVTAGPTREALDPVRFVSNRSSGRMGYALAKMAVRRGAKVTLVSGPVALETPDGVNLVPVTTTADLHEAMLRLCVEQDIVIQAAAPADYRPDEVSDVKIKSGANPVITMTPNPDVAAAIGDRKHGGQVIVAFAAETGNPTEEARRKLVKKNADLVVANDVTLPGAGFDIDTNIAVLVTRDAAEPLPLMSKEALADAILARALELRRSIS